MAKVASVVDFLALHAEEPIRAPAEVLEHLRRLVPDWVRTLL